MKIYKAILGLLLGMTMVSSQAVILESCSWDNPGSNPYTNPTESAIDHYMDIAPAIRAKLKQRIKRHQYDDLVTITRDQIEGTHSYQPQITDMHFGGKTKPQICMTTTRTKWPTTRKEIGLVYCEGQTCILIPTICNNVSRITRLPESSMTTGSRGTKNASPPSEPVATDSTPTNEGGGGGGGGGSLVNPAVPSSVTETGSAITTGGIGIIPAWTGSFGGGSCCYTGPIKPTDPIIPIVPPIFPPILPPIITPPVIPAVPEPSTVLMFLLGLGVVLLFSILRKRKNSGNK